jgi:hypothetical protein
MSKDFYCMTTPRVHKPDQIVKRVLNYGIIATLGLSAVSGRSAETNGTAKPSQGELARQILADQTLREVHQMAQKLLKGGLNAGRGYGEVWIRDLNTFIGVALEVNPPQRLRDALLTFFKIPGNQRGYCRWLHSAGPAKAKYAYRTSSLAPDLMAHKNRRRFNGRESRDKSHPPTNMQASALTDQERETIASH